MAAEQREDGASPESLLSRVGHAVASGTILALASLGSYWLITAVLTREYFVSRDDDLLGGMWAAVATIFVYRESYDQSARAALSRILATLFSFLLCLIYLLIFPFHVVGMAVLIGVIAIILALVRRSEDIITAAITAVVVMVVAGISPEHAWMQPILRLVDTAVGILVGIAAAWISLRVGLNPSLERSGA
ncbi:MAG TPA: FUSC family protein [Candidatus Sulfotelmatobacter sp.]